MAAAAAAIGGVDLAVCTSMCSVPAPTDKTQHTAAPTRGTAVVVSSTAFTEPNRGAPAAEEPRSSIKNHSSYPGTVLLIVR